MSTKITEAKLYGDVDEDTPEWHIYTDCADPEWPGPDEPIHLELCGQIVFDACPKFLHVVIPRKIWNKILAHGAEMAKVTTSSTSETKEVS